MEIQLNITPLNDWGFQFPTDRPLIISGPCSAETEEQVMDTCVDLAKHGSVNMLRAGIWKPRTRPNCFEGIGSIGLKWIKEAGKATNLPVTVEVANVKHVYEALRMGIDVLWIGARTTVNPFSVQEIADALQGVDIPVMVKNPVNPDLALWMGAFERLNKAGITKLAAIHRGFSSHEKSKYRNRPQWEIPIEFMRQMPNVPVICDPSHICGRRDLLQTVAQKAMDLSFDGLMIESHNNPSKALSDAEQQVTPTAFGVLIDSLVLRNETSTDPVFLHNLEDLREMIDNADRELVALLAKRMKISERIGEYKRNNNIKILQADRWDEIIRQRSEIGIQQGLSAEFMFEWLNAIHKESIRHQGNVMNHD
ncbi:MAG: bifunctional 3-deoxy-7-phosphoheptulonate synthase/chorismate mutase type II [Chitinophagales bacterium]|jgi:chorismate mutase|nr:bifunctional 3-deoxy-7-phosphoheptulonate synthase/chorismate mutase type II [Chitinophagales bacterium]